MTGSKLFRGMEFLTCQTGEHMLNPSSCFSFRFLAEEYRKPSRADHFVSTEISTEIKDAIRVTSNASNFHII
jgi:hypothetical protein